MADPSENTPARFIVGIDLGTTNCSAAFVDTAAGDWTVHDLPIPQITAPSTLEPRHTLPSFHFQAAEGEFTHGELRLPWDEEPARTTVGHFARDHGAQVPGRLISSAKSWLCHAGVDRTAGLLPWHGAADVERLSPIDASARYLSHIRSAWNHGHPDHPLERQDVILTVPASFDEVARELTVEAARRAGLPNLVLVEEPQAAFYAWIDSQRDDWHAQVQPGQKILIADIGGGTTDFTLIRVKPAGGGKVMFHRIAVGQHLILGGDNLDLAIAHHLEARITGGQKLPPRDWGHLLRSARSVKEQLLSDPSPDHLTITLSTGGSKLIGGARQADITRDEARSILIDGFLPRVPLDAKPATRRSGFQEFSLPYAPDPAITRYLAQFLTTHRDAYADEDGTLKMHADPARPDLVLFNGGFFASALLKDRFLEVLSSWFSTDARPWRPHILDNVRLDLAVSRGAAYYGSVRRGHGTRIKSGLAHSYYIGVETSSTTPSPGTTGEGRGKGPLTSDHPPAAGNSAALCLLPAGTEEGQDTELPRTFSLLIRQPVEFPLYYSATRTTDTPGLLVEADPEQLTPLPPIRTVLQSGKKSTADQVQVRLHARLTEIGTLDVWAAEAKGDRKWRLQFDVRSASRTSADEPTVQDIESILDESLTSPAHSLIKQAFSPLTHAATSSSVPAPPTPASLVKRLELVTTLSRQDWPATLMRSFWEALMEVADARKLSPEHESRWLNLTGFCLRPGYGLAVDDWRVAQTWRLFSAKVAHAKNEQTRAEWWILWRRLAGGLSGGQQLTAADPLIAALKSRLRPAGPIPQPKTSPFQYGPHETAEAYRFLGSLELLPLPLKQSLVDLILTLLAREKSAALQTAALFTLGRLGSRVPVYGPLNTLLDVESVAQMVQRLLLLAPHLLPESRSQFAFTLVQLSRKTSDRYRDLDDPTRTAVLAYLESATAPSHYTDLVKTGGHLENEEQRLAFGESLPRGLRIE